MRGGDTRALRAFNERLILGAIRQHGPLSKADLARVTGLSAQAAATIVNGLLADGLVQKRPKVRGQVGQPYTPLALDPAGAYALGVKIGRRSVEAVLVDFQGQVVAGAEQRYAAPLPALVLPLARDCAARVLALAPAAARRRIAGVGVAMPGDLPAWSDELDVPADGLAGWAAIDVAEELADVTGIGATVYNDATAACAAEMALGAPLGGSSALYVYLGTFVGGGLVVDGRLCRGSRGNAAAIGSMPMATRDAGGRPRQLIHEASVFVLERRLRAAGLDPDAVRDGAAGLAEAEAIVADWMGAAADALARAVIAAASVLDIEVVIVDGLLHPERMAVLVERVRRALPGYDSKGLSPFTLRQGSVGRPARVLGAALLPLGERFSPDPDVLVAGPRERAAAALAPDRPSA